MEIYDFYLWGIEKDAFSGGGGYHWEGTAYPPPAFFGLRPLPPIRIGGALWGVRKGDDFGGLHPWDGAVLPYNHIHSRRKSLAVSRESNTFHERA